MQVATKHLVCRTIAVNASTRQLRPRRPKDSEQSTKRPKLACKVWVDRHPAGQGLGGHGCQLDVGGRGLGQPQGPAQQLRGGWGWVGLGIAYGCECVRGVRAKGLVRGVGGDRSAGNLLNPPCGCGRLSALRRTAPNPFHPERPAPAAWSVLVGVGRCWCWLVLVLVLVGVGWCWFG